MYSILINANQGVPFIISQNTTLYAEYIDAGYEQIATGTRKELLLILDECIVAYND